MVVVEHRFVVEVHDESVVVTVVSVVDVGVMVVRLVVNTVVVQDLLRRAPSFSSFRSRLALMNARNKNPISHNIFFIL